MLRLKKIFRSPHAARVLAALSCLALCLALLPGSALAEESYGISVLGTAVTSENCQNVLAGTEYSGTISYDPDTRVLTMDSVSISRAAYRWNKVLLIEEQGVTLRLVGENSITETSKNSSYALTSIQAKKGLVIDGSGSLSIQIGSGKSTIKAIDCTGNLTVKAATLSVQTGNNLKSGDGNYAIYVKNGDFSLTNNASVTAKTGTAAKDIYGIYSDGRFSMDSGLLVVETGDCTTTNSLLVNLAVKASHGFDIRGGELRVKAGSAPGGLSAGLMTTSTSDQSAWIENATLTLQTGGGYNSYPLYTNGILTILGSKIHATSAKADANSRAIQVSEDDGKVLVKDSTLTLISDEALYSLPLYTVDLEIENSSLTAIGGKAGLESYGVSARRFLLKSGEVSLTAGDAADWSIGLWTEDAAIQGGNLKIALGQAEGTNAITTAPTFPDFKAVIRAGSSEADAVPVPNPTEDTFLNSLYIGITPYTHAHAWSQTWEKNETHHWHACTAADCNLTAPEQMDAYEAHIFDQKVVDEAYLISPATTEKKALYAWSCVCGAAGEQTFESGELVPVPPTGDSLLLFALPALALAGVGVLLLLRRRKSL